jgi:hypothetical protein
MCGIAVVEDVVTSSSSSASWTVTVALAFLPEGAEDELLLFDIAAIELVV